jgi:hypothetical protein
VRNPILALAVGALAGCGGSTPTGPTSSTGDIVAAGPQVLRILSRASCSALDRGVLPLVHTRVDVARSGSEWMATASNAAAGDVQLRFRQSGSSAIAGSFPVTGSITGTAVHMPELFPGPGWEARAVFSGPATLSGVAFSAGLFGSATAGLDGVGSGTLTLADNAGNTCTGTTFSWSIFPLP